MIICRACKKSQPEGAIFCSECGTKLTDTTGLVTQSLSHFLEDVKTADIGLDAVSAGERPAKKRVILQIIKTGEQISLVGQDDFTIGRTSEGQSIIPDIDLSPFDSYQEGVSRIHASIKISDTEVSLIDLSSINGTSINDIKIAPNQYHHLHDGDIISLGKFKIQILIPA
jgi:hypothetical protein